MLVGHPTPRGRMSVSWRLGAGMVVAGLVAGCSRGPERVDAAARTAVAFAGASVDVATAGSAPPRDGDGVTVTLERVADRAELVSFGVPVKRGVLRDVRMVSVETRNGLRIDAAVKELLPDLDAKGRRVGVRA